MISLNQKAVSQVVAALLLIAIAVAASLIVYVFSIGYVGQLQTNSGTQIKEQVILEAYNWNIVNVAVLTLRNVGTNPVQVADVFLNGAASTITFSAGCSFGLFQSQTSCFLTLSVPSSAQVTVGEAYPVKIVSANGAIFQFSLICGQTG